MRQLALGIATYAQDWDQHLPASHNWGDAIFTYVRSDKVYRCPADSAHYGYAYNAALDK